MELKKIKWNSEIEKKQGASDQGSLNDVADQKVV
jgi:hypothetical protein